MKKNMRKLKNRKNNNLDSRREIIKSEIMHTVSDGTAYFIAVHAKKMENIPVIRNLI